MQWYRQFCFFFSSRRRHTRFKCDWSSDVCSSDLSMAAISARGRRVVRRRGLFACRDRRHTGHPGGNGAIRSVPRAAPATRPARGLEGGGMKESLSFDHRPDAALGDALRRALDPGDPAPFVARVLARADQVRAVSWDTVLARWSRLGIAAAALV